MEKYIWVVKAVHEWNEEKTVDNLFAVTSEEQAKKDVKSLKERYKRDRIELLPISFKTSYFYKKISLFE